jgi:hypothetical protein
MLLLYHHLQNSHAHRQRGGDEGCGTRFPSAIERCLDSRQFGMPSLPLPGSPPRRYIPRRENVEFGGHMLGRWRAFAFLTTEHRGSHFPSPMAVPNSVSPIVSTVRGGFRLRLPIHGSLGNNQVPQSVVSSRYGRQHDRNDILY